MRLSNIEQLNRMAVMEAAFASESGSDLGQSSAEEIWTLLRTLFGHQRRSMLVAAAQLDLHPAQAGALLQLGSPLPMHELARTLACDSTTPRSSITRSAKTSGCDAAEPMINSRLPGE